MMMTRPNNGRANQNYEGNHMSPCSSAPQGNVSQDHVAAIFYSSGTTGLGKGVMITHRNLIAAIAYHYAFRVEKTEPTVVLYTVPYFHIFGFSYCLRSVALKETAVVMERFQFRKMLRAVEEFRVTLMPVAPPVVVAMVKDSVVDEYDLRSLEWVGSGGAPLGIDVIRKFYEKYPSVLLAQGYALTETTGVASRAFTPEEIRRWGSVGKLLAMFEAKIVDPDSGAFLPPGRRGELWLRSPSVMKGYVGNAKATLEALGTDGWLRTGDICYFDDEGYLFVVDRLKELIKYKGYQVAPAELDELLLSHPQILDAAVIPYPDEEAGEVPMALVVRHSQSSLDENEVMDFVAKQVAPYKKIRRVRFVTSIPKSPAGKILRKELGKIAMLESKI
ncbi:hypothetical protein Leryth_009327 [Lithospermum erythrorhizon]|nr:hypothetical protein Leryth_009327 [Lithospermum erythrorhizon]